jgi:hypothetical protein
MALAAGGAAEGPTLQRCASGGLQCLYGESGATDKKEQHYAQQYFRSSAAKLRAVYERLDNKVLQYLRRKAAEGCALSKHELQGVVTFYESAWGGIPWPMGRALLHSHSAVAGTRAIVVVGLCPKRCDRGHLSTSAYSKCCESKLVLPVAAALARSSSSGSSSSSSSSSSRSLPVTVLFEEARGFCDVYTKGMAVADADGSEAVLDTDEARYTHAGCWHTASASKRGVAYSGREWTAIEQQRLGITVALAEALCMQVLHVVCMGTRASQLVTGSGLLSSGSQEAVCSQKLAG